MKWKEAADEFERHLRVERAFSIHTRRAYLSDVAQLADFAGDSVEPEQVDAELLEPLVKLADLGLVRRDHTDLALDVLTVPFIPFDFLAKRISLLGDKLLGSFE